MGTADGSGTVGRFALLAVDRDGELRDDDEVLEGVLHELRDERNPVTDIVVLSHGWQADTESAIATYGDWVRAMAEQRPVRFAEGDQWGTGSRLLVIGIHWPSAPWEDPASLRSRAHQVAAYAEVIGDPAAVEELEPLLANAEAGGDRLSPADESRLRTLDDLSGLAKGHVGAPPGEDRGDFDPKRIIDEFTRSRWYTTVNKPPVRTLLTPLWVTSFWKMKSRARHVGTRAVHRLIKTMRAADPTGCVRIHLVGHSFGAIVCAGAIQGEDAASGASVESLTLLQGALSLWAFAPAIPDTARHGFFSPLISHDLVRGPILTTQSRHDRALALFFRAAATVSRDNRLRPRTPRYGAVGTYGIAGLDGTIGDVVQKGRLRYSFERGGQYNLECSEVITPTGFSVQGAHSNLVQAELAAVTWAAILSTQD